MILRLLSSAAFVLAVSLFGAVQAQAQATGAAPTAPSAASTAAPAAAPALAPAAIPTEAPTPVPTPVIPYVMPTTAPFSKINLSADSIDFYWNRYVIQANGHVRIRMNDGTTITGDAFSSDLRLNRFLIAGHVRISAPDAQYEGAAFAEFLNDARGYFIPIAGEPDRWTFLGSNYAMPYVAREIPPDAFFFQDTSRDAVFLNAKTAVIWPLDAMLFYGATVHVLGQRAPGGNIYLNYSSNLNFHQNSLTGAIADVGYPFAGGRYWYSTLHARYDNGIGPYLGFEQHYAWDNAYVVASVNPFDRAQKQYNLLASDRISPDVQFDTFQQINLTQYGWTTPVGAAYFGSYSATAALRNSFTKLTYNVWNYGLASTIPSTNDPDHPTNTTLQWTGFDHRINQLPLTFALRSGIAEYDDTYGLGSFAGTPYTNLWSTFFGATLYTQSIKVHKDTYLTASYDRQRTFFSLPHYVDTQTTTGSLSHLIGTKAAFSITYQNVNSGDYAGSQQLALYPATVPQDPISGAPVYGYAAFSGFTTSRTLSYLLAYTPKPTLSLSLNYQHYTDFPRPVGLLYGRPPNYFDADLKIRLTPQVSLEVGRAYYFNWYGAKWAPQMLIQFGP